MKDGDKTFKSLWLVVRMHDHLPARQLWSYIRAATDFIYDGVRREFVI